MKVAKKHICLVVTRICTILVMLGCVQTINAGTTEMTYDAAGNLLTKLTSELRSSISDKGCITYTYDHERLKSQGQFFLIPHCQAGGKSYENKMCKESVIIERNQKCPYDSFTTALALYSPYSVGQSLSIMPSMAAHPCCAWHTANDTHDNIKQNKAFLISVVFIN